MKRHICILLCCSVLLTLQAQQAIPYAVNKNTRVNLGQPDSRSPQTMRFTQEFIDARLQLQNRLSGAGSRAVNSTPLGTAGNLYTILNGNVHRIAASAELGNTVVFIHRSNPDLYGNEPNELARYRYDVSYDGGMTWDIDNGVLNPSGNQQTLAGRFPNVAIHNPAGNTNPQNAYLTYMGTWLPFDLDGNWDGHFTGSARLNNDTATWTENIHSPYNDDISIALALCNGAPGIFWAVNWGTEPFDLTRENVKSVLLFKGVWNTSRNDVDWVLHKEFTPSYDKSFNGFVQSGSPDVAFDPSGQYGWLGFMADCTFDGKRNLQPVFYSSRDGGATWQGPVLVDLASFGNILAVQPPTGVFPIAVWGDIDMVVDVNGNPHMFGVAGWAPSDSTALYAGLAIYDFTYDEANRPECKWQAIHIDTIATIDGAIAYDEQGLEITETNRPQASRSPDGTKVFIAWLDSDPTGTPDRSNSIPNLFTRGYDVTTGLATSTVNWTTGDPDFDSQALFASTAPATFGAAGSYYIPTVFTKINISGLGTDPAEFHYVQNVVYNDNDFTIDIVPPVISLNGTSPVTVVVNGIFSDPGATATDNVDGNVTSSIQTTDNINLSVPGSYAVSYAVTDASGNAACEVTRVVNVVSGPDATPPTISLIGLGTLNFDKCDFIIDPGATATDDVDGDITNNIVVTDNIPDTLVPGTFTISYDVNDGAGNPAVTQTRTVVITDQAPVITLVGSDPLSVEACSGFQDPGGYAEDKCAGILTLSVSGAVDDKTPGSYLLTYSASDSVNPPVTKTRVVVVTADVTPPDVTIVGDNPQYVYLGTSYNELGATAADCGDDLTSSVNSNGSTAVNVASRGNYTVIYTVQDASNNTGSANRTVKVNTEPDPDFTFVVQANTVFFTDASLYDPTAWTWDFGDQVQNPNRSPAHTYSAIGDYNVCLEVSNTFNTLFSKPKKETCKTVSVTSMSTGISEINIEKAFSIYPNPTAGMVTVMINNGLFENVRLSALDIVGKVIQHADLGNINAGGSYDWNLSGNADGVYFIKIHTEQGVAVKRVIVSNK